MFRTYHRIGQHSGLSMPLWVTLLYWLFVLALLDLPAYGVCALLGSTNSAAAGVVQLGWLALLGCWCAVRATR